MRTQTHGDGPARRPLASRLVLGRARAEREMDPQLAEACERTARSLEGLPASWTVLRPTEGCADADHVAVGPGGVFLISTCKPGGCVRVKDGVPWLRQPDGARAERPGTAINRRALEPSRGLHRELRARTDQVPWVHPVVVLWAEFPQRVAEGRQIAFVSGRELSSWLRHRPPALSDAACRSAVVAVLDTMAAGRGRAGRLRRNSA